MINFIIFIISLIITLAIIMTAIHLNQIKEDLRVLINIIEEHLGNND